MAEIKMTSVLVKYVDPNDARKYPGVVCGDWVQACRINGCTPEDLIAELGNWDEVELDPIAVTGDYTVFVRGPCGWSCLTWADIDELQEMLDAREQ